MIMKASFLIASYVHIVNGSGGIRNHVLPFMRRLLNHSATDPYYMVVFVVNHQTLEQFNKK